MINLGWAPCIDCCNIDFVERITSSIVFMHLRMASQSPELPLQIVARFLKWNDGHAVFKRLYLLHVLLATDSVFCKFPHWHNNMSRGISNPEDAIDLILSFITGIRREVCEAYLRATMGGTNFWVHAAISSDNICLYPWQRLWF